MGSIQGFTIGSGSDWWPDVIPLIFDGYQTTDLGVRGSTPLGRANFFNYLEDKIALAVASGRSIGSTLRATGGFVCVLRSPVRDDSSPRRLSHRATDPFPPPACGFQARPIAEDGSETGGTIPPASSWRPPPPEDPCPVHTRPAHAGG